MTYDTSHCKYSFGKIDSPFINKLNMWVYIDYCMKN